MYIYSKSIKMTKNAVYPTVILRVSYGYPSVKGAKGVYLLFSEDGECPKTGEAGENCKRVAG